VLLGLVFTFARGGLRGAISGSFGPVPTATTRSDITVRILPTATLSSQPTTTPAPIPTNTPVPSVPTPTATPAPSCTSFFNGTAQLNVDQTYVNLDTGQASNLPAGTHMKFELSPAGSPEFVPLPGTQAANLAGSSFESVTCAQLRGLTYGAASVPGTTNAVFAMKLPNGHLSKVLVTAGPPNPALQVTTYQPQ